MNMSDIDYGLSNDLDSYFNDPVHYIEENESKVQLENNQIKNPFFLPIGGINIDTEQLYKRFKRIIILCRKNIIVPAYDNLINKRILFRNEFDKLINSYEIITGSLNMIKNKTHQIGLSTIESCLLEQFNHSDIELENEELVLCLTELTLKDFNEYKRLYENSVTVKNINNLLFLHRYYNCSTYFPTSIELSKLILHIRETSYWKNPTNCNINLNNIFNSRLFNLTFNNCDIIASTKSNKRKELDNLIETLKINNSNTSSDYPHTDSLNEQKTDNYKFKYYSFNDTDLDITVEQVNIWFDSITDKRIKFNLFIALMLSKKYCHLVFNNSTVLTSMEDIIHQSLPFMRYIFGYANLYMYLDEYVSGYYTTTNSRYVFTLDTVNKLPFFP